MSIINKNITLIALLTFWMLSSAAHADGGFLMGIQGGQSNLHNVAMLVNTGNNGVKFPASVPPCTGILKPPFCTQVVNTTPSNTGFAFRLFGGAGFNRYVAVEAGLAYFTPSSYVPPNVSPTHEPQIREYAFDVLGRFTLPIQNFGIFAKAGAAAIYKSESGALEVGSQPTTGGSVYVRPEIGFGVSYSFSSITIDLSTNKITQGSNTKEITYNALGIIYQFVDQYCGQFLC